MSQRMQHTGMAKISHGELDAMTTNLPRQDGIYKRLFVISHGLISMEIVADMLDN